MVKSKWVYQIRWFTVSRLIVYTRAECIIAMRELRRTNGIRCVLFFPWVSESSLGRRTAIVIQPRTQTVGLEVLLYAKGSANTSVRSCQSTFC